MAGRNMSFGDGIDWADPAFSNAEFQDSMTAESPYGNSSSAFAEFTNIADYSDSPGMFGLRTPSKSGPDGATAGGIQQSPHGLPNANSMQGEASSQDSSSDASSRRKRKSVSESPMPDAATVDSKMQNMTPPGQADYRTARVYEQNYSRPLPNLSVEHSIQDQGDGMFDFNSAASSPNLPRDFNQQLSLDANMAIRRSPNIPQYVQESPATINPGSMFTIGSRDQSPATNNVMFNTASPNAIFSTPSSDSNDLTINPAWNTGVGQNPAWPTDFNQFASPGLTFTPSPIANGATPNLATRAVATRAGRSPLHIAPISTKSRVETQINVIMTLEKPPPNVEHLHLPLHTIAKSKLLAKEDHDKSKTLELHTMLVCTSAMHNPALKEKALKRAEIQDNLDIQRRAEEHRPGDEDRSDGKNVDEEDRPANGGEVKICNNCIQRERKRAGRKKLKKEEEQQHWERYESERVVVFNSNEYLPFKPAEQMQQPGREGGAAGEDVYKAPEGAIAVQAQMRIACYCRHQSEKEGFQVIFTLKDQQGTVVAQQISDSILITDDHKTHPPQLTTMPNELLMHTSMNPNGLPTSYSMVNLQNHQQQFSTSRSAGNLQELGNFAQQFNPHSHIHQLPGNGYPSQTTSGTMTPTASLSRSGSPTSAGQTGPNKKRKSSNFNQHKRLPSNLQMTRVDTSQPSSANTLSGVTMSSNFSPTGTGFGNDSSFMTIPNNNSTAQFFGSQPTTPASEHPGFAFSAGHQLDMNRNQNPSAYFSHPSSAVPSRSNSPILQHNRNLSGYTRQPLQTTTNQLGRATGFFGGQAIPGADGMEQQVPRIQKVTPAQGPTTGGTEVSIFGYNFTSAMKVMFGDQEATMTFYGHKSLLVTSPPGRLGPVHVRILVPQGSGYVPASQTNHPIFNYQDTNPEMMEMALKYFTQQQIGDPNRWVQYTNEVANQFMQTSISPAGIQTQNYPGGNMMARDIAMRLQLMRSRPSDDSTTGWNVSSVASCDYDADESECAVTVPPSRRASVFEISREILPETSDAPASAALLAWRDALAAQIQQFQQTVQDSVSSFQLPALPPLPDYHDYSMVRRLSLLMTPRSSPSPAVSSESTEPEEQIDSRSRLPDTPSLTSSQPPPYSELFPEKLDSGRRKKDDHAATSTAILDAVADAKCALAFDQKMQTRLAGAESCIDDPTELLSKAVSATSSSIPWLWTFLLMLLASIVLHAVLPYVTVALSITRTCEERVRGVVEF